MAEVMSSLQQSQPYSSSIKSTSPSRIFKFKKRHEDTPNFHNACIIKIFPHTCENSNNLDSEIERKRNSNENLDDGLFQNFEMGCYRMKMHCFYVVTLSLVENHLEKYKELTPLLGSNNNFLVIHVLFFDSTNQESFIQLEKYLHILKTNHALQSSTLLIVAKNTHLINQKKVSAKHALIVAQKHNALYIEMGSNDEIEEIIEVGIALKSAQFGERYLFSPFDAWRISLSSAQREISIPPNLTQIEQEWRDAISNLLSALEKLIGFTNINPYITHKELAMDVIKMTKELETCSKELEIINFSLKLVGNEKNTHNTEDNKTRKELLTILKHNEELHNQNLRQELMFKLECLKEKSKTHQPKEIADICEKFATDLYSCEQMFLNEEYNLQMEQKENVILRKPGFKEKEFKEKILTQLALYKNSANHMQAVIFEIQHFESKINQSIKRAETCLNNYNGFNILNMQPMLNFIDFYICKKSEQCHFDLEECSHTSKTIINDKEEIHFLVQSEEVIQKNRFECLNIVEELKQEFKEKDDKLMQIEILKHNLTIVKTNELIYSQTFKDFMANQNILLQNSVLEQIQPKKSMVEEFFNNAALKFEELTKFKFDREPLREEENDEKKNYKFSESDHEIGNGFAERIDGIIESAEQPVNSEYEKVSEKVNEVFLNASKAIQENLSTLAINIDKTVCKIEHFTESQIKIGEEKVNQFSENISNHSQGTQNVFKHTIEDISDSTSEIKRDIADRIERVEQTVHETISITQRPETITVTSIQYEQRISPNTVRNATEKIENQLSGIIENIQQNSSEIKNELKSNMIGLEDTAENFAMFEYQDVPSSVEKNFEPIQEKVSEGMNSLVNNVKEIEERAENLAKTVYKNGNEGFNNMKGKLNAETFNGSQYSRVTNKIEDVSWNAVKNVTENYERITSKVSQQINEINPSIKNTSQNFSEKFNNGYSSVSLTGKKIEQTITSSLRGKANNLEESSNSIGNKILDEANESYDNVRKSVQKVENWVENASKEIRND